MEDSKTVFNADNVRRAWRRTCNKALEQGSGFTVEQARGGLFAIGWLFDHLNEFDRRAEPEGAGAYYEPRIGHGGKSCADIGCPPPEPPAPAEANGGAERLAKLLAAICSADLSSELADDQAITVQWPRISITVRDWREARAALAEWEGRKR